MSRTPGAGRTRSRLLLPIIAVLLTVISGGVMLWTVQVRQHASSLIPVAIVNADKPVTTGSGDDQKTVAAGRQLAGSLTQPDSQDETPLAWTLVDTKDGDQGLRDGTYYAVLTIPASFSADVTSTQGKKPTSATLKLSSNDAASKAVAAMADLSVQRAAGTLGDQVTNSYVNTMLQNITTIHTNLTSSASSAQKLADSSHQIASSSHQLASSADSLSDGSKSTEQGAQSLSSGAQQLSSGASQTSTGASQTATGAAQTSSGAAGVASGSSQLASAAGQLASGAQGAANGASRVSTGAHRAARINGGLVSVAQSQSQQLDRLSGNSERVANGAASVSSEAQELASSCPRARGDLAFCARLRAFTVRTRAHAVATRALQAGVGSADRRAGRLVSASQGTAAVSRAVAGGASGVASGTAKVSTGVKSLDSAAGSLASGASQVASGASQVASGASQVAKGAASVASGAANTASGASQLASGTSQQAAGAAKLASGAHSLASGADQQASGSDQLASGLDKGAKSVPSYSKDQSQQLADVVTTPVGVDAKSEHQATVAAALIPVVLGVAIWLGTLMMFLTRGAVPSGPAWAQATAGRRVLYGWLPAIAVGAIEAGILLGLIGLARVHVTSPVGLVGFSALAVLAFAATNQALVALFGGIGRLISLAFAIVEAAALGGLAPIQTAPAAIQALNGILPLPRFVSGATELLLGGHSGDLIADCVTLAGWTVLALLVAVVATGRRRPALAAIRRPSPGLSLAEPADVV